jgi:hypothetical protein
MKQVSLLITVCLFTCVTFAQPDRWQQRIKYTIDAKVDVLNNKITGKENIEYWNNSPDTLKRVFLHLYWNAFQPGSSMDVRSRELGKVATTQDRKGNPVLDWDRRVKDTIMKLKPNEIGYQRVSKIVLNGKTLQTKEHETILEVILDKPILPKTKSIFSVEFEAQVPLQIRRAGRDNAEGIRYSMSQWYPKMSEYDRNGWNPNPYVAREFYGVWGDYDVKITIDKNYLVAASGVLQNPDKIGMGYSTPGLKVARPAGNTITWNFVANNVHDFVFAADPEYAHEWKQPRKDLTLRVIYQAKTARQDSAWKNILWMAEKVLPFIEKKFGKYPWPVYSFIHGGDGGMEYPMATLMNEPSIGTAIHEWMHSWYQQLLGTNESLYPWMDEGFAKFADTEVSDYYLKNWANKSPFINDSIRAANNKKIAESVAAIPAIHADSYKRYFALQKSPYEEPMSTHADHFNTNYAYSNASYYKGSVFLEQLAYIVGTRTRDSIMLAYYNEWKFKHPTPDDFIRVAEKVSGIELDWYKEYWINSTKAIDYTVGNISADNGKMQVTLKRIGKMPMPVDVLLTFKDGTKEMHYIPLNLMYGGKTAEDSVPRFVHEEWRWTHPEYTFETSRSLKDLKSIEIDPSGRMADIDRRVLTIPD